MKTIIKSILILFSILLLLFSYASIFGIETDKFNSIASKKIKKINQNLDIDLKKIKVVLDPFRLSLKLKTIGPILKNKNRIIELENLKSRISLRSILEKKFAIENLEISTKSLEIKNLITFLRTFKNTPELFILEKILNKGFLVGDIQIEFDEEGNINENYSIKGIVKDLNLDSLKGYNFKNLNFIFSYKNDNLDFKDVNFLFNELNFFSDKISVKKIKKDFLIKGKIDHNTFELKDKNLDLFFKNFTSDLKIQKIILSSKNNFSFKLNKRFKLSDFKLNSKIIIDEFLFKNSFNLKSLFPNIKKNILLSNNKINLDYKNKEFLINGEGEILLQDQNDIIEYSMIKKNELLSFETGLKVKNNPISIHMLNYKTDMSNESNIQIKGSFKKDKTISINSFSLNEKKNKIEIKDLEFNEDYKITDIYSLNLNFLDIENKKNIIKFQKKNDEYSLNGSFFNANHLIDDLLISEENKSNIFNIDKKINILVDEVYLDEDHIIYNFSGDLIFKDQKLTRANLIANFTDDKKLRFTVNSKNNTKITTLFMDKAEPVVNRYNFVKGFKGGELDFYSSKKLNKSNSMLKIYNFRLRELPILTKILTLASLQGIADILSGEGIGFDEFEMSFQNKENLMTIDEIYAIGPAISILMDGYIEKGKVISLRGTLVPATTINKALGSIPVLGKILVGTKTGEGVFGVSFKIKGPPKKLETTVNPIKTLTPRFITRTLEKIKKN
tara:strand:+ start:5498 stop:7684 length:2187 start_codon:yes stop_codon:yes gene_type:complete